MNKLVERAYYFVESREYQGMAQYICSFNDKTYGFVTDKGAPLIVRDHQIQDADNEGLCGKLQSIEQFY